MVARLPLNRAQPLLDHRARLIDEEPAVRDSEHAGMFELVGGGGRKALAVTAARKADSGHKRRRQGRPLDRSQGSGARK